MTITEIRKLVEIIKENELVEFELEEGEFSIRIRRGGEPVSGLLQGPVYANPGIPATAQVASQPQPQPSSTAATEEVGIELIKSPMVGTFYRAPSPDSDAFVKEGQTVASDTIVCIIEAMKVMNEIQAENSGTIVECLVADGDPVEFGQPLFKIKS